MLIHEPDLRCTLVLIEDYECLKQVLIILSLIISAKGLMYKNFNASTARLTATEVQLMFIIVIASNTSTT